MRMVKKVLLCTSCLWFCSLCAAAKPAFSYQEIGPLSAGDTIRLNNYSQVIASQGSTGLLAYWDQVTPLTQFGVGQNLRANFGITDTNRVYGTNDNAPGGVFEWTPLNKKTSPYVPGQYWAGSRGGALLTQDLANQFQVYRSGIGFIKTVAPPSGGMPVAINDSYQIAGRSAVGGGFFQDGSLTSFQDPADAGALISVSGLNDSGTVAGFSTGVLGARAFTWSKGGGFHLLDGKPALANALNAGGTVVGEEVSPNALNAILWQGGSSYVIQNYVLNLPAKLHLDRAADINDVGQIVGIGHYSDFAGDHSVGFLLDPVVATPEPACLAVLGLGSACFLRKRKCLRFWAF